MLFIHKYSTPETRLCVFKFTYTYTVSEQPAHFTVTASCELCFNLYAFEGVYVVENS